MALTETRPEASAEPSSAVPETATLVALFGTGDHKTIGRLWISAGSLFLLAGIVLTAIAGFESVDLGGLSIVSDSDQFAQLWSLGADLTLFAGIVPVLVGLAIYLVPLQVGSPSLAFGRGAAAAFWIWAVCTGILVLAYVMNGGPSGGRTDYVVLWTLALGVMLGSLVWAFVCVATTLLGARAQGMSLDRVPVSAWGFFVFSIGGILALPIVMAELLLAFVDVRYGYLPTDVSRAGLVSTIWSSNLAPAIYWISVPVFGIMLETVAVHSPARVNTNGVNTNGVNTDGRSLHRPAMVALALLGVLAFAGDFFSFGARGRPIRLDHGLLVVGIALAALIMAMILGLGAKAIKDGQANLRAPLVAGMMAAVVTLAAAVLSLLALLEPLVGFLNANFDTSINLGSAWSLNGSMFHEGIRGLVVGGAILGLIAGVHHWGHKIWGRSLDDRLGVASALAVAAGASLWGLGLIISGFRSQSLVPSIDAAPSSGVEAMNLIGAIGAVLVAIGVLVLVASVAQTALGGGSSVEPWRGLTLEWATLSPPPVGNFAVAPLVTSATPLAGLDHTTGADGTHPSPDGTTTDDTASTTTSTGGTTK